MAASTVMSEVNVAMINLFNKWRLEQINQEAVALKVLGSYPKAVL